MMIRRLIVSLAVSLIAATSLSTGARAQNAQQAAPRSPESTKEIQSRLFELNYIVWPDGNWDDRTRAAIRNWHQSTNRPGSDTMSADDIAYLRTAAPIKAWGGVVYDSKGHYRLFANGANRREVVDEELGYCKRQNLDPKRCDLDLILQTTMAGKDCTAVSHADWKDGQDDHSTSLTARRNDIKTASNDVVDLCAKTAPRENCKLLAAVCADGSSLMGALEAK